MSAHSATKGAVLAFSLSLASEVSHRRIRVVPVSPGTVATPLTARSDMLPADLGTSYYQRIRAPFGAADPEQIAGVIAFAAPGRRLPRRRGDPGRRRLPHLTDIDRKTDRKAEQS
ncbi:SDR family oxidoreductase [Streptomyces sp. NPDC058330]|uniref:SDR family oxidoreductase n=1 Tax=Streptomyces sp. NPDC058330 TaxID=3346449 RepID=UPI0036EEDFEA